VFDVLELRVVEVINRNQRHMKRTSKLTTSRINRLKELDVWLDKK
jgi:hypothetical protein